MRIIVALAAVSFVAVGCGPECPADSGNGTLELTLTGLPPGVTADVVAVQMGAAGSGPQIALLPGANALPAGEYTVTPRAVAGPAHALVRNAFGGPSQGLCVRRDATLPVTAAYAAIPTSGKLWMTNGSGGTTPVHGFSPAAIATSATVGTTVEANTRDTRSLTFDRDGNLWVLGGTTADPTVSRYTAERVAGANRDPDLSFNIPGNGCLPARQSLAFDAVGNLWIAMGCEDRVVRITTSELEQATPAITPGLVLTGIDFPSELAFDAGGNLWVVADGPNGTLHQYTEAQLALGATAPTQSIDLTAAGTGTAADADAVAFDAAGNLWATVSANYNLAKLTPSQLIGTGNRAVAPANHISLGVGALPDRAAIDDSGGIWMPGDAGRFGRLAPSQQSTDTTYAAPTAPEIVIDGSDLGYAGTMAFYPAAAGLPLAHALP